MNKVTAMKEPKYEVVLGVDVLFDIVGKSKQVQKMVRDFNCQGTITKWEMSEYGAETIRILFFDNEDDMNKYKEDLDSDKED